MANLPFVISGVITDTDATNPNGAKVILRNNTNGETTSTTTNSSGQYALDAANLTSGYLNTDSITIYCAWGLAAGESSFLISSDTHTANITLTTVADSADTNYCTVQNVLDELGDKSTSDISFLRIRNIILRAEAEIDERTESSFTTNTETDEVYDFDQYTGWKSPTQLRGFSTELNTSSRTDYWNTTYNDRLRLNNYPLISITSLYKNENGQSATDSWTELTEQEGSGGDFIVNYDTGTITFVSNPPGIGVRKIKVTYTWGRSTVPKTVERLCILLSVRDVLMSKGHASQFDSVDSISLEGISISKGISGSIAYYEWLIKEIERLWSIVGNFANYHV